MSTNLSYLKATLLLATIMAAKVSFPAIPLDLTTPTQQRIAIHGVNELSIGWNKYSQPSRSCVDYGTSSNNLSFRACCDASSTYLTSRTYFNSVVLTNLQPATNYYYKIESTNSTIEHFYSPRTPRDHTPFTFNTVNDLGVYGEDGYTLSRSNSKRDIIPSIHPSLNHTTIGRLATNIDSYELLIHAGDFAYADDWLLHSKNWFHGTEAYKAIIEQIYNQVSPIMGRKPYMIGPGNHEASCQEFPGTRKSCPEGQQSFADSAMRFSDMPTAFVSTSTNATARVLANKAQRLARPPFWYSFGYGMAHILMFDTETDFDHALDGPGGYTGLQSGPFGAVNQQIEFIEADLASVDRSITPWVIVAGHRPWYTTGIKARRCRACQSAFEDIFYKYGVDLATFGHIHNSQRFLPMHNKVLNPNGMDNPKAPMYVVAGGSGNIEGLSSVGRKGRGCEFAYAHDFSYASISPLDRNSLKVDFVRSSAGEVLDSSVLFKEHEDAFVVQ